MAVVSLADIQNFTAELAREFSPEKVILFGSHSWGKPDADSDVDLLVITQFEGSRGGSPSRSGTGSNRKFPLI